LKLARAADGAFDVVLSGAPSAPRAVQAEIAIDSSSALILDNPAAPVGLPLDTVRLEMRGTNRAILFSGDKRGVKLPGTGVVARFHLRSSDGSPPPTGATLRLASALVVANDATAVAATLGAAIPAE